MSGIQLKGFKALSGILDDSKKTTTNFNANSLLLISVDKLHPSPYQPRRTFDEKSLQELAVTIRNQGIVQPLVVRKSAKGYEIIAGERRWRASILAGLKEVPALLRNISNTDALAIALIENIQRENLNPIDEALGIKRLLEDCNLTHEQVAELVGKSRSAVTNLLRLLSLEEEVKQMLSKREIDSGHARALVSLNSSRQIEVARNIKESHNRLTVRQTEDIVRQTKNNTPHSNLNSKDIEWQNALRSKLTSNITIQNISRGKKKVTIVFENESELEQFVAKVCLKGD